MQVGPTGEKRWTIVLSLDMVDFTGILHTIGDEKTYALLEQVLGIARAVITQHGGHVIDVAGDGMLAAFGAPKALENAPLRGCEAALAFQNRMATIRASLKQQFGVLPQFRIGLAGGDAMIAHLPEGAIKVVGDPANKAARLQALAGADEIIIGASIYQEAEGFISATPRGDVTIKGFADPIRIYALTALQRGLTRFEGVRRRGIVDLISRSTELDIALKTLNPANPSQLLVMRGVAGIGKSRLTYEITTRLAPTRPVYLGQCSPNGQQNFGPIYDILRQISPAKPEASQAQMLEALDDTFPGLVDATTLADVIRPPDPKADPLNQALQERALLLDLLRTFAQSQQAVFVIEDAHWCDPATSDLLTALTDAPLPMIITGRPTFAPPWLSAASVTQITLAPLSAEDIAGVVAAHLDGDAAPALSDLIATKSDGIPLIAEEIIRALQFGDQLEHTAAGLAPRAGNTTLITGNLSHLVLSRVDSLSEGEKRKLHYAAAIGRDFSADIVHQAAQDSAPLDDSTGLIEQYQGDRWRFTHALIRDAVYDSMLMTQKQQVHLDIARAFADSDDRNPARLAEHYILAGQPTRAVPYLIAAARQDLRVYALSAVDQTCERAMQIVADDPGCIDETTFGDLAGLWTRALDNAAQYGRVQDVARRVLPRLESGGYTQTITIVRTLLANALAHTRDYATAATLAQSALQDAQAYDDALGAAWAKSAKMRIFEETHQQPPDVIETLAAEIMPVAQAEGDLHLAMSTLYLLSAMYRSTGRRKLALATADQIAALSRSHNDRRARGYANWIQALVFTTEGNPEATREKCIIGKQDVVPGTADDYVWQAVSLYAAAMLDPPELAHAAIVRFKEAIAPLRDVNMNHAADWIFAALAFKTGHLAEGWRAINTLVRETSNDGNKNILRQALLLRSEVLLSVAGLIDPQSEAPPDRPVYPRTKPGLSDIITFANLRLRAKRLAAEDLEHCIALAHLKCGVHYARAQIGLGLIAASRGQTRTAAKLIEEGHDIAKQEGVIALQNRAQKALAGLGLKTDAPT